MRDDLLLDVLIYKARDGTSDLNWNEEACVEFVRRFQPTHIVLGPGPGEPTDSPLTMGLAHSALSGKVPIPILGICLGHQALGMAAGMKLMQSPNGPVHGAPRTCLHNQTGIFSTLPLVAEKEVVSVDRPPEKDYLLAVE